MSSAPFQAWRWSQGDWESNTSFKKMIVCLGYFFSQSHDLPAVQCAMRTHTHTLEDWLLVIFFSLLKGHRFTSTAHQQPGRVAQQDGSMDASPWSVRCLPSG